MSASIVEGAVSPPSAGDVGATSGIGYPVVILVFSFILLILLQAWFVRRIATLRKRYKDSKTRCERIREEVAATAEHVSDLTRAADSNNASIGSLEREVKELTQQIEDFLDDHETVAATLVAESISSAQRHEQADVQRHEQADAQRQEQADA